MQFIKMKCLLFTQRSAFTNVMTRTCRMSRAPEDSFYFFINLIMMMRKMTRTRQDANIKRKSGLLLLGVFRHSGLI